MIAMAAVAGLAFGVREVRRQVERDARRASVRLHYRLRSQKARLVPVKPRLVPTATFDGRIAGVKEPLSVFNLKVHRLELEGRWIVVDRRFVRLGDSAEEM
jgi:hypothetical protein